MIYLIIITHFLTVQGHPLDEMVAKISHHTTTTH